MTIIVNESTPNINDYLSKFTKGEDNLVMVTTPTRGCIGVKNHEVVVEFLEDPVIWNNLTFSQVRVFMPSMDCWVDHHNGLNTEGMTFFQLKG